MFLFFFYQNLTASAVKGSVNKKKLLANCDGIEPHPIFLQTLMDFDENQLIRDQLMVDIVLFCFFVVVFSKTKEHYQRGRESKEFILRSVEMNETKIIWTNELKHLLI